MKRGGVDKLNSIPHTEGAEARLEHPPGTEVLGFSSLWVSRKELRLEELKKLSSPSGRGRNDPPLSIPLKFRGRGSGFAAGIDRAAAFRSPRLASRQDLGRVP